MKDEEYVFFSDVSEKAITRRSARNKRTHCGKGGKVRMPSDYLTKKELAKMSGECISYQLNEPMTWAEFNAMPDDLKISYINLIRLKWSAPISRIGEMMGVAQTVIQRETARLGLCYGKGSNPKKWDKDGFYAWVNGVRVSEEPVVEEPEVEEDREIVWDKPFVFEVDDIYPRSEVPLTAVPEHGDMTFKCPADLAMETIKQILSNEMVEIRVSWRVIDGNVC